MQILSNSHGQTAISILGSVLQCNIYFPRSVGDDRCFSVVSRVGRRKVVTRVFLVRGARGVALHRSSESLGDDESRSKEAARSLYQSGIRLTFIVSPGVASCSLFSPES